MRMTGRPSIGLGWLQWVLNFDDKIEQTIKVMLQ